MQSTGLKDKSGKDIWEGDILGGDFNREYSEVFFNEKWAQFMTRSHISTGSLNKIDHLEVIGNFPPASARPPQSPYAGRRRNPHH
jgi:hypothetical protein